MSVDASEAIREVARRFCLPCALVREARQAFDYYCALDNKSNVFADASTAASDCAGAASTTQGSAHNSTAAPAGTPLLGVKGLRAYYADIGLSFSAVEVAELVTGLLAEPAEVQLFRAQEAAQRLQQGTGDEMARGAGLSASVGSTQDGHVTASQMPAKTTSRGAAKSSGTRSVVADECGQKDCAPVTPSAATVVTATVASMTHERKTGQGLPFALFLHLMLQQEEQPDLAGRHGAGCDLADGTSLPIGDEEGKAEMGAMFRALDHDGDGVLSAEDVCHDVKYLMELDEGNLARDREVLRLACMRPDELHAALRECDGDGDGLVTLADLMSGFGLT